MNTHTDKYNSFQCIHKSHNSSIYKAFSALSGEWVVLKKLNMPLYNLSDQSKLKNEYRILQKIQSDHVVKPIDYLKFGENIYFVLEYCEGVTLEEYMKHHQVTLKEFLYLAINISTGLFEIHNSGVIHKGINPSHIMYNPKIRTIKFIDFAIATEFSYEKPIELSPNSFERILAYIAPEQTGRMNHFIDYRTDFYSLGITFYEMLCRRLPFVTDSPTELIYSHIAKVPQTAHEVEPTIPTVVSDLIAKLMSKIPEDRYKSAKGLIHDLTICLKKIDPDGSIEHFELGNVDHTDALEISKKLYGRETEFTHLMDAFSFILKSNKKMIAIRGLPGVGKTSLVNEMHKPVLNANGIFLSGKLDQFQRNVPYSALSEAINQFLSYVLSEPELILRDWQIKLADACKPYGKIITDKLPLLKLLIGDQPPLPNLSLLEERIASMTLIQNILMTMASFKHPVVLFIDDIHLADIGSLVVIEEAFRNEHLKHILFIICYRESEVDEYHPLSISFEKINNYGGNIEQMTLLSLSKNAINQLLSDTLHREHSECFELTELVYEKTKGNPFHVKQFLKRCHSEGLIFYDDHHLLWDWNFSAIKNSPIQENVVDFVIDNMMAFPEDTLSLLSVGACIGHSFNLDLLSTISEYAENVILEKLKLPVSEEIIYSIQTYNNEYEFQFAHDRFELACYTLLSEEKKMTIHLRLAKFYENKALTTGISGKEQYLIADNYFKALKIIKLPGEKRKVASIILKAVHAATLISAYDTAKVFLEKIIESWANDGLDEPFMFTVYTQYHGVLCALAEYEHGDEIFDRLIKMNNDPLLIAESTYQQISSLSNRGKFKDAFMLGVSQLQKLGVDFPEAHLKEVVHFELDAYYADSRRLDLHEIDDALVGDVREKVIAKLLDTMSPAAIFYNPMSNYWASIINVNRILEYGYTKEGLSLLLNLMVSLIVIKNDYHVGYVTALKVLQFMEKHHYKKELYYSYFKFTLFINHWFTDIETSLPYVRESFISTVENRDFETACYCYYVTQCVILETCKSIEAFNIETKAAIAFAKKIGNEESLTDFMSYGQLYHALKGETISEGSFDDEYYNEKSYFDEKNKNGCYFLTLRALSAVIYSDFETALVMTEKVAPIISSLTGLYLVAQHNFLYSLAICKRIEDFECSTEERDDLLNKLKGNQIWLEARAADAPDNFLHLYHCIEAEILFIEGNHHEAVKRFELSIDEAATNKRPYHYALLCELAAMCFIKMGINRAASFYIKEAYLSYLAFEASGKIEQMKLIYDDILTEELILSKNENDKKTVTQVSVDLNSVMKAAQAIAGEILLESILEKLIVVLLENAGAQNIFFLIKKSGHYEIQAESHSESNITTILEGQIANSDCIPMRIVNYVERTHDDIILGNALESVPYGDDDYIVKNNSKSIICMPVLSKGELKGILYLENNLVKNAFGFEHIETLKVIASQLAISLENAYLYNNLRELVEERTRELRDEINERKNAEQQLKEMANHDHLTGLPNRKFFMEILNQSVEMSIIHNKFLSILFIDLDGFKGVNDQYGHDKGDLALKTVASRLISSLRSGDSVARMGGDEFIAVLDNILSIDEVKIICQRIITTIEEPIELDIESATATLSASIGVSVFPFDGNDAEELIKKADQAMYLAKNSGKHKFVLCSESYKI